MKKIYFILMTTSAFSLVYGAYNNSFPEIPIENPTIDNTDQAIMTTAAALGISFAAATLLVKKEYGSKNHFVKAINKNGLENEIQSLTKNFYNQEYMPQHHQQKNFLTPTQSNTIYNYPPESEMHFI